MASTGKVRRTTTGPIARLTAQVDFMDIQKNAKFFKRPTAATLAASFGGKASRCLQPHSLNYSEKKCRGETK